MREIKFRAFSFADARFYNVVVIRGCCYEECYDGTVGRFMSCTPDQYTGLKDKNGVEIYEGDIMHVDWAYDTGGSTRVAQGNYLIEYKRGMFQCRSAHVSYYSSTGEVIGNIYENKELLDVK